MRNRIQKIFIALFSAVLVVFSAQMPIASQTAGYSWYCAHVKDHVQPTVGQELRFVEDCNAYYADHTHRSPSDGEKVIYLTFDAGYENGNVAKILDTLRSEQVPAAFFVLGHLISAEPQLIMRMVNEGHSVCNHTVRHKDMSQASEEAFVQELTDLEKQFEELTGTKLSPYYRPPEGKFSKENLIAARNMGYHTIFWSFAYPDWDNARQMSAEKAKTIILENLHNGEVMLLHPTSSVNAEILGDVIREAKAQGYRFGTLDELTGNGS